MVLLRAGDVAAGMGPLTLKHLLWIVGVGVLVRLAAVACAPEPGGLRRLEPSVIAENLNAGRGFVYEQYGADYRAWKEPLHIVLLATVTRWAGDGALAVWCLQWLFGVVAAVGVAWLAFGVFSNPVTATLAGVLAALNPFLVYYDTQVIHPLSLDVALFTAVTGTILLAVTGSRKTRWTVLAGLVMGLALWQRAALLAAGLSVWLIAGLVAPRANRPAAMGRAAMWLAIAIAVVSPWLIRNARLLHRPVFTTDFSHIVWLGNNPWSNGTYSDMTGRRVIGHADPAFLKTLQGASELEQSDLFWAKAMRFIRDHPGQFAGLVVRRVWAFVWFSPNAGVEYPAWQGRLYRVGYSGLLALGLLGAGRFWRRAGSDGHHRALLLGAAVAGLAAVHALTAMNMKHRVPLELTLSVFAAEALACGWARARRTLVFSAARIKGRAVER